MAPVSPIMALDWGHPTVFDWAALLLPVLGLAVAVLAILQVSRTTSAERYVALQLDLLKELSDLVNTEVPRRDPGAGLVRYRAAISRLRLLDPDLPSLRIRFSAHLTRLQKMHRLGVEDLTATTEPLDGLTLANPMLREAGCNTVRDLMFDEITGAMQQVSGSSWRKCRILKRSAERRLSARESG